jgi:hypothetical protein
VVISMQLQNGKAMASLICFQAAKYGKLICEIL